MMSLLSDLQTNYTAMFADQVPVRLSTIVIIRAHGCSASHTFSLHINKPRPGSILSSCELFETLILAPHDRVPSTIIVPNSWGFPEYLSRTLELDVNQSVRVSLVLPFNLPHILKLGTFLG